MKNANDAYAGKYMDFGAVTYQLIPEIVKGGCKGCALQEKSHVCENIPNLLSNCRQGFILKVVDTNLNK